MDELGEKLDALLHDPQQLGRIAQLASSLVGDGGETQPPSEPQPEPGFDAGQLRRMLSAVRGSGRDSASRHLLEAMKPYLAEKRRRKIDRAMKLARLASLAELAAGGRTTMYNRYQGNSGQVERMPDAPHAEFRPRPSMPPAAKQKPPPGTTGGGLQQLLQKFSLADLESEDLLLILVLYLLYRESGDKELLFILGGMLFL